MTPTVEQLCDLMAERQLIASADLSRLRARWFRPDRKDAADVDKFGQWLAVNEYLTGFRFRMLRGGKASLLRLNQYQIVDHLTSGPFAGSYLATDPVQRRVVVEVLAAERAANPEAVRAFQAAAEQAMTVRHPNVSLTLDFGEAQGRYYLVREFDEGETLAAILARRGKLQHLAATRLFALALLGLQALHDKQVPAGPLSPECLLLAVAGKLAGGKGRIVKILQAGVPHTLFDPAALDDAIRTAAAGNSSTSAAKALAPPQDDLCRLGAAFYRSLTGLPPFPPDSGERAASLALPIRRLAPEVPEMLAHLVESLLDPDPTQRPSSAARVAKSLRVYLASEEEAQQSMPEEQLVPPNPVAVSAAAPAETPSAEDDSAVASSEPPAEETRLAQQFKAMWQELRPGQRDLVFLGIGAIGIIVVVLFLRVLTGIQFINLVCLLAGGVLSFFVERLLRLRAEHND